MKIPFFEREFSEEFLFTKVLQNNSDNTMKISGARDKKPPKEGQTTKHTRRCMNYED